MISRIGSQGYTQSANRVQRSDARPVQAGSGNTNTPEPAAKSAAVIQIGSDARARASASEGARQTSVGADSAQRVQIEIKPVVAQPVPDFNAPTTRATESADKTQTNDAAQANDYQAPTNGYRVVA